MKATELRSWNYVYAGFSKDNHIIQVTGYNIGDYENNIQRLSPIPLTDQWLKDFGYLKDRKYIGTAGVEKIKFETCLYGWSIDGDIFHIVIVDGKFYAVIGVAKIELPYVHTLQNLSFALTQKELTK